MSPHVEKALACMEAGLRIKSGQGTDADRLVLAGQDIERLQAQVANLTERLQFSRDACDRLYLAAAAAGAKVDRTGRPLAGAAAPEIKADF